MAIKILAAADLHLGKRTSGLAIFGDNCSTRATWVRMVDFAIDRGVDMMLLAGDVVDQNNRYFEASGALQEGFRRLGEAGIDVFVVTGNHDFDVLPQILRNHPFPRVRQLGADGRWEAVRYERSGEALQLVGWSYPRREVLVNPLLGLAEGVVNGDYLSVGLLHADVDKLDSRYGPVALNDLQRSPVNVWILGHIHKPIVYSGDKFIRYPGSPQALSAKETGSHGALLLTVDGGRIAGAENLVFSNCRFERLEIEVTDVDTEERFRGLMETAISADANPHLSELDGVVYLVYDVLLTGRNNLGREIAGWAEPLAASSELLLACGARVRVRNVALAIRPPVGDLEGLARERSPAGVLAEAILAIRSGSSTAFLDQVAARWLEQFQSLTNSTAFQPLQEDFRRYGNPRNFRTYIEEECNRLLAELLYPVNS